MAKIGGKVTFRGYIPKCLVDIVTYVYPPIKIMMARPLFSLFCQRRLLSVIKDQRVTGNDAKKLEDENQREQYTWWITDELTMHSRKHTSNKSETMREEPIENEGAAVAADDDTESGKLLPLHHRHDAANGGGTPSKASSSSESQPPSQAKKVGTALFYATSSLGVIFANKIVLSTYKFPSVQTLALLQFTSTTLALKVASMLGYVNLLPISVKGIKSILPLSTCYLLNILTGLSATQNLSLPMMVLLRRASILMTMVRAFQCMLCVLYSTSLY